MAPPRSSAYISITDGLLCTTRVIMVTVLNWIAPERKWVNENGRNGGDMERGHEEEEWNALSLYSLKDPPGTSWASNQTQTGEDPTSPISVIPTNGDEITALRGSPGNWNATLYFYRGKYAEIIKSHSRDSRSMSACRFCSGHLHRPCVSAIIQLFAPQLQHGHLKHVPQFHSQNYTSITHSVKVTAVGNQDSTNNIL